MATVSGIRERRQIVRKRWLQVTMLTAAAAAGTFGANIWLSEVRSENAWGLAYGVLATVFLVVAAAFGVRRRTMRAASTLGAGRSSRWLAVHLYGGAVFLLLVLMHSGFRFPSGWVTMWLWGLSFWTVASGVVGRLLQKWIPRLLASALSTEVLYERIPELVEDLGERAAAIAATADEAVRALYESSLTPAFERPRRRLIYFLDITGGIQSRLAEFGFLRPLLAPEEEEKLDELERLYRTKLELDAHYTLQLPLRWWLYLHLPTSFLLLVFLMLHLYTVLAY